MRKVIDSNYLRNLELRKYLSSSKKNFAVLTDYAAMEAYKGDPLINIQNSMSILTEFPEQVFVLKNTLVVSGLSGRGSGLQKRLIEDSQTKNFKIYCQNLAAAKFGNDSVKHQLIDFGEEANRHLEERMLAEARNFPLLVKHIADKFTHDELVVLRKARPYTNEMLEKLIKSVLLFSVELFQTHPRTRTLPPRQEMPNTFIFRYVLCIHILAFDWISIAGPQAADGVNPKNLRNDIVDASFAAYATFFDGLLSDDDKSQRIYHQACIFLAFVFGCNISGFRKLS